MVEQHEQTLVKVNRGSLKYLKESSFADKDVSRLFEMGLAIPEVSLISGHVSWATLKRHTHLKPKTVLEKMNASRQRAQEIAAQSKGT